MQNIRTLYDEALQNCHSEYPMALGAIREAKNRFVHEQPKRSEGEESRPTGCSMRDSSACGLRMTGHQNQCGELLVSFYQQWDFTGDLAALRFMRQTEG